ncbi:MAG: acyl-CoA dehydrogenase family protein [Chloroflexi bacterium]|nr:acyl-CoA dehydrogenase family protein [Chloroflexota bacterium]
MDFELPREIKMLQGLVRRFVEQELLPLERQVGESEELAEELLGPLQERAKALGLWLMDVPREFGGLGLSLLARCVVYEQVARARVIPFRNNELFGPHVDPILYHCTEAQRQRFLYPVIHGQLRMCFAQTEPDAGTDPAGMRTRAVREGDHYVLSGAKRFISAAGRADFAEVICVTDPERPGRGISCLLVDMKAPGVKLVRQWPTMMGDAPWEISFDQVQVPVENRIGEEGQGFELGQQWITVGRVKSQSVWSIGVAQRALEMAMDYARQRVTFGQPLAERQAVQFMIADSAIELRAARLMIYDTAWRFDQGQDVRDASYMAKIYCTETAGRVVDRAIQIHGGVGLTKDLPLEYWYRQLRSLRITEGATEVLRWRLARNLMRERR